MNILFLTTNEIDEKQGGTERISASLCSVLTRDYNHNCYSAFFRNSLSSHLFEGFKYKRQLYEGSVKEFQSLIQQFDLDIIINQGYFAWNRSYVEVINKAIGFNRKTKQIVVHHYAPGWEEHWFGKRLTLKTCILKPSLKKWLIYIHYDKLRRKMIEKNRSCYYNAYLNADKVVLLSQTFKHDFLTYGRIPEDKKISCIPNMLSFADFFPYSDFQNKKKTVLIVSRLDEEQKRISLALLIWSRIQEKVFSHDWKLHIVGHGASLSYYQNIVKQSRIPNVLFMGKQDPRPFYSEASLFMMTSRSEGWGLTITEAQQLGVVPVAFNSYKSLEEIILNGDNGYVVPDNDIDSFVEKMGYLMENDSARVSMAKRAIDSSKRFLPETIGKMWQKLFISLS